MPRAGSATSYGGGPPLSHPHVSLEIQNFSQFLFCREVPLSTLEHALAIAAHAHAGQVDKAGEVYILHPIRVMQRLRGADERIAAILHDVVEDTSVTLDDLRREGFSEVVVRAVEHLTKRDGEEYMAFVRRPR